MFECISTKGNFFQELYGQYFASITYFVSIVKLKQNVVEPEIVYNAVMENIANSPQVFKNHLDLFDYNEFLENWKCICFYWEKGQKDLLKEIYTVNYYESRFLYKLLRGERLVKEYPKSLSQELEKFRYDIAWENVSSTLKSLGI